ncbi:hypothetical protein BH10ACI2_BH10ACI2_00330 [soil metagenome]
MTDFQIPEMTPEETAEADAQFDAAIGLKPSEDQRSAEVADLLAKNGITQEQIENFGAGTESTPYDMNNVASLKDVTEDWADKLGDQYRKAEATVNGTDAVRTGMVTLGEKIADELVPTFGESLKPYEETSLTFGFPPAVDALIKKTGIDAHRTALVLSNFRDAYALAGKWKAKAEAIFVTDEMQTDLIKEAKDLHRIVRDERINVEKRRRELKEPSLREGQLIDGVANVYKELLEPVETHLFNQAKFVENLERERKAKLAEERGSKLALFEIDPAMFPLLGEMSNDAFEITYSGVREQYHSRKEAEKAAERARVERERQAQIENERLRAENQRLEDERRAEAERTAEQRRIAEESDRKHREAQAELDRQAEQRKAEADRIAAEDERKRLAPDKDKLLDLAHRIHAVTLDLPVIDPKFDGLLRDVTVALQGIILRIRTEAE